MTAKLTALTPSYRSFENDQVLTASQLNEFLNYFDDQDRLSRICLSGVGIVCGFKINFTEDKRLILSQGCGITTDGDLLHLQKSIPGPDGLTRIDIAELIYKNYSQFTDDKAFYKPFFYREVDGVDVQIPLWELIPEDLVTNEPALSTLPDLKDKVLLLYLESYDEDSDLCVGVSCDNQGIKQVQNLRVLLVNQIDADYILSADKIYNAENLMSTYLNLSDVSVPRVILNQNNTATFAAMSNSYKDAIKADYVVDNMKTSFTTMLGKLGMSAEATQINGQLTTLFGLNAVQPTLYFQYRYDILKDVVDTYMEMKELFLSSSANCCPDIHSFPKHLMLGKLMPTDDDILYKRYRHSFYKSPILCQEDEDYDLFKNLVTRVIEQLNTYISQNIPRGEIKITPSRYRAFLGDKAIPYYYNLQSALLKSWNFEKTQRNKQNRNLSYHTGLLSQAAAIQRPLKYNLEPFNFLNIEGHQGYLYKEAMEKIHAIRYNNGLSFDLKALGITVSPTETINMDEYECEFADLNAMLDALRKEHECVMGNASYYLSSYSLVNAGVNRRQVTYMNPIKLQLPLKALTPSYTANIVQTNLDTDKDSMGKVVSEVFKTFDGCSANDMILQINRKLANRDFSKWDPIVYDITINKPMEILANSFELIKKIPRVKDLTPAILTSYAVNASNVCSLAKRLQAVSNGEIAPSPAPAPASPSVVEGPQASRADYNKDYSSDYAVSATYVKEPAMVNLLMNQLSTVCCSVKKLESIMDEIEARKQRILLGLKLSKFIESHAGLEHQRGTEVGGTFVLVYITDSVSGIPANTVVADFSLPYLCCSDCSSVNFIMPRPVATLSLSKDRFCIGNDTGPLVFTPYPLDGVIEADRAVPGVSINGNQLLIDPALVPSTQYGKPIYFTLNKQITGCNLTIYKSPVASFTVPTSPTTQREITFTAQGNYDTGTTFLWNFGDGKIATSKTAIHEYAFPVNDDNKVTVKLTVTPPNGACPTIVEHDIEFMSYEVSITPTEFCSNNTTQYPFTITPDGTGVVITGDGVTLGTDGQYVFNPAEAGEGLIPIFVNDIEWMKLTVKPAPNANVVGKVVENKLELTSNMTDVAFYYWSFSDADGNKVHADITNNPNPVIPFSEFTGTGQILVKLFIQNACASETKQITVNRPGNFAACSTANSERVMSTITKLKGLTGNDVYVTLTTEQKKVFTSSIDAATKIAANSTKYFDGTENVSFAATMSNLIFSVHSEMQKISGDGSMDPDVKAAQLKLFMELYSLDAYSLFPSVICCQAEEKVIFKDIQAIFVLMDSHLDNANSSSFKNMHVEVDPTGQYVLILNNVITYRTPGSYSWNSLNDLVYQITHQ